MKRLFFIFVFSFLLAFAVSAAPAWAKNGDILLPTDIGTGQLPIGNFEKSIIPDAIKFALLLMGSVSFGVFVYAGVMLVISQGNEEEITKFKNILIWSIVGLLFMTISYGLVRGILEISFK